MSSKRKIYEKYITSPTAESSKCCSCFNNLTKLNITKLIQKPIDVKLKKAIEIAKCK